jgi:uncharacterized alkaline shock family protein YloU
MSKAAVENVTIAPGVVETIIALAISQVDGVASVGGRSQTRRFGISRKHGAPGVLILEDEGLIKVVVHIQAYYGYRLQELGEQIRAAIADALLSQAGISVDSVDITIDGIAFKV